MSEHKVTEVRSHSEHNRLRPAESRGSHEEPIVVVFVVVVPEDGTTVNRHINTSARLRFGSDRVCQVEADLGTEVVVRPRALRTASGFPTALVRSLRCGKGIGTTSYTTNCDGPTGGRAMVRQVASCRQVTDQLSCRSPGSSPQNRHYRPRSVLSTACTRNGRN